MPLTNQKTPPNPGDIEISVFGPGFGECVLVHVGEGRWFVIDSCFDRQLRKPAALAYFEEIGVDPAKSVEMILVTHWHDDHVAGIDRVVEACPQAPFWCSDALQCTEFLQLIELKLTRPDIKFSRGVRSIGRVVDLIGPQFNFALGGMRIYQRDLIISGVETRIEGWVLSPSQYENYLAKQSLGALMLDHNAPEGRIPDRNPNHAAVACALLIGNDHILLGADLEEPGDHRLGWSALLSNPGRPQNLHAAVFKIPHHGSATAHHDATWNQLVAASPHAVVTPWNLGGNLLPKVTDVLRVVQRSGSAFISKARIYQRPIRRQNMVQKLVPRSLRALTKSPGHVRLRKSLTAPINAWNVDLFDGADRLENFEAA
jgi:hypothetical protein